MPDPKQLVAQGYDQIAETHAAWASHTRRAEREHYTQLLLNALPPDSAVLELGCGTGLPTTAALAQRFQVTGVDIAARHIALARTHVPLSLIHILYGRRCPSSANSRCTR